MKQAAVIVAGGSGSRMQSELPKQFLPLAGRPVLVHTVQRFLGFDPALPVVLVLPADHMRFWQQLAPVHIAPSELMRVSLTAGGATRTESVQAGLEALSERVDDAANCLVAIHDGVRPFVNAALLARAYDSAAQQGASVACVPVKQSLRHQPKLGDSQPVDRGEYFAVQTPQTFRLDQILASYRDRPDLPFTDDASLHQAAGHRVVICEGSYDNIKLTTPEDMFVGEGILRREKR